MDFKAGTFAIFGLLAVVMIVSGCVSNTNTTTTTLPTTTIPTTTLATTTTTESTTTTIATTTTTGLDEVDGVTQGIYGEITQGPMAPACDFNRPETCEEAPYNGTIIIKSIYGVEVKRFTAGADGKFAITLNNDEYKLVPVNGKDGFPTAAEQTIIVKLGKLTHVAIHYDTGIR